MCAPWHVCLLCIFTEQTEEKEKQTIIFYQRVVAVLELVHVVVNQVFFFDSFYFFCFFSFPPPEGQFIRFSVHHADVQKSVFCLCFGVCTLSVS